MKAFTIASVVALASVATAQLDNIPKCALSCFLGPLGSDGCGDLLDFACHCKQGSKLLSSVQPCVQGACSADDQKATIAGVEKTCAGAGVPIEIPDTPGSSATPTPSLLPSSVAPSSAASSAVISDVSATSSLAPTYSYTTTVSPITPSLTPTYSYTATINATTPAATGNSTASSTLSEFPGAAAKATQAAGLLGAAALALLAL
ncbi:hypothetical protein E8E13_000482 [Curvularia kusanoi]|uniref:CFEM domain-containing protein n=1 Tax=Curvularia kusanoi TaxID=90978 RepID=A0A9P4T5U8_CURKU|nr:hypothetical protein E8E13_000482 [Curvularia kusanoi]